MYLDVSISIYICRYINICEAIKIEKKKKEKIPTPDLKNKWKDKEVEQKSN